MTKSDHKTSQKDYSAVSASQQLAIEVLLAGGTDSEAAQAASVTRESVNRAIKSGHTFQELHNLIFRYSGKTAPGLLSTALMSWEGQIIHLHEVETVLLMCSNRPALESISLSRKLIQFIVCRIGDEMLLVYKRTLSEFLAELELADIKLTK